MKNEFVSYEMALELKELGFDEPCFTYYYIDGDLRKNISVDIHNGWTYFPNLKLITLAPTFSQAFRWFREKYKLHSKIEIQDVELDWYFYEILDVKNGRYNNDLHEDMNFKSYEEAEIACLRKLIEITKKYDK